jgi:argininosuccinate lyase
MHLSRLAEDFILYSTKEFDYLDLPEEFCTGSSLMPHKKNPDFLELVRGYTGRIYGNLVSVLTTMKGLPLTYNRDMQLDKEPLFSSVEIVRDELMILAKFIAKVKLNKASIDKALEDETLYAVDLAEYLVKVKKIAFGDAHDIVGKLIRYSEDNYCRIKDIPSGTLKKISPSLDKQAIEKILG